MSGVFRPDDRTGDQSGTVSYDPNYIRRFYDEYGEREWGRLVASPRQLINFEVHRRYLEQYVKPGDRVLELGAGPGRFTIELAKLGARVTVSDISRVQLELNREKVGEAGYDDAVVSRELADIVDLSRWPDGSFDATVCYGGPLSYVFDRAGEALGEMLRVTRSGGPVLLTAMSLVGTIRFFLPEVLRLARELPLAWTERILRTGDLVGPPAGGHEMHLYRWSELRALLEHHGCTVLAASASNFLSSVPDEGVLDAIRGDAELWGAFLEWEVAACREEGAIDGGSHMVAVVKRRQAAVPS